MARHPPFSTAVFDFIIALKLSLCKARLSSAHDAQNREYPIFQVWNGIHGFTGKRLPILAESRETEFKRCFMGPQLAGKPILLAGTENSANGIRWLILVIGSK